MNIKRRRFSKLVMGTFLVSGTSVVQRTSLAQEDNLIATVIEIENRLGARLGLAIFDEETGKRWNYQSGQRFPMCSTFKAIAVGAVLAQIDKGEDSLDRVIVIEESDLVSYSPVTENRLGNAGMTLAEICEAALTMSDNTAGNKLLESIGGPDGLTEFARSVGDDVTRLDRWETGLNEAAIGDARDTTSPEAMSQTLRALLLGKVLSTNSREQFKEWMVNNKTGDAKLRAGVPSSWQVGDKTGGGNNGTMADVAIIWPPNRKPLSIAVYMTETEASFDDRNLAISEIGAALSAAVNNS